MGDGMGLLFLTGFLHASVGPRSLQPDDFDRWCLEPLPVTFEEWLSCQPNIISVGSSRPKVAAPRSADARRGE